MAAGHEARQAEELDQLQSEVDELRGQLAELEREKGALMKNLRSLEDRQVRNWKWIQDATKFSGVSVNKCSATSCTFHFHPMWKSVSMPTYAMTVDFTKKGYDFGQCFLPESINVQDLDNTKPLNQLVWDISNLVDSFIQRQQQIKEIEEEFGENDHRKIISSVDTLKVFLRVKVSDGDSNFMIIFHLKYHSDEILPHIVELEVENGSGLAVTDTQDFQEHCEPFLQHPLLEAFRKAFEE